MSDKQDEHIPLTQVVSSVLASFFGVQSSKNRERDFQSGKIGVFIGVGVVMTAALVATLASVVAMIL